jgi:integrase
MNRLNRLNARTVATVTKPGRHADGGNLYLSVSKTGARSWVFMFKWYGKQTELGFGSARDVTLARARELATAARAKLADGIMPSGLKSAPSSTNFGTVADKLIETMRPSWRSEVHAKQWEVTLTKYAAPLRNLPVDKIDTADVLAVLKPLWLDRYVTARRLRDRIERVLDAAKARGLRQGENPALWRGHLDHLLPRRPKVEQAHHAAMPYTDVPEFMAKLRQIEGVTARALEFTILTAARAGEVLGAKWTEFSIDGTLWTIPAPRMKSGREHQVPLSQRAVQIVREMMQLRDAFVFPGRSQGTPLSPNTMRLCLQQKMELPDVTIHGFRSSFRDWAGDCTSFPHDVVEAALAHALENRTEAAYRRGTALEKRRQLMQAWDNYLAPANQTVVTLKKKGL